MKISTEPKNKVQELKKLEKEIVDLEAKARNANSEEEFNEVAIEQNKAKKRYTDLLNLN